MPAATKRGESIARMKRIELMERGESKAQIIRAIELAKYGNPRMTCYACCDEERGVDCPDEETKIKSSDGNGVGWNMARQDRVHEALKLQQSNVLHVWLVLKLNRNELKTHVSV